MVPLSTTLYNLLQFNSTCMVNSPFVNPLIVLMSSSRLDSAYLYVSTRTVRMSVSVEVIDCDTGCVSSSV